MFGQNFSSKLEEKLLRKLHTVAGEGNDEFNFEKQNKIIISKEKKDGSTVTSKYW